MIGFRNTHNQPIYVNRAQVLYVTTFEEDVSVIALAVAGSDGKPVTIHVRGSVEMVPYKLSAPPVPAPGALSRPNSEDQRRDHRPSLSSSLWRG